MKKQDISDICNISRQQVYNLMNNGEDETTILKKYTRPLKEDEVPVEIIKKYSDKVLEDNYKKGYTTGYEKGQKDIQDEFDLNKLNKKISDQERDLENISRIIKVIIFKYQKMNGEIVDIENINQIYEIVKDY